LWAELLKVKEPDRVEVLARYGAANGWLDGQPAITMSTYGSGRVYLVGAYLDEVAQQALLHQIANVAQVAQEWELPGGVEVRRRVHTDGRAIHIFINHGRAPQDIALPEPLVDCLSNCKVKESVSLEPYGVAVLMQTVS
jgi:beta-galactosidase